MLIPIYLNLLVDNFYLTNFQANNLIYRRRISLQKSLALGCGRTCELLAHVSF